VGNDNYWEARIANIKESVSMRNLVDHYNVPCQSMGEITQVHCPFHGNDQHASARIYETNTMYCWVCAQMWDVISFVKDLNGVDFRQACGVLEDIYGIAKPDKEIAYREESFKDFLKNSVIIKDKDFDKDFDKIANHLIANKAFYSLNEYVRFFYFLDNLFVKYRANNHQSDAQLGDSLSNLFMEITANT